MLNLLIFLEQRFGDSDWRGDSDAAPWSWPAAVIFCLLIVAAGAYAVVHLWLITVP